MSENQLNTNQLNTLTSWHGDWPRYRFAVLGLGVTGFAAADTLCELGSSVLVVASQATPEREQLLTVVGAQYVRADLDQGPPQELIDYAPDVIIISPGFRPDSAIVHWAESADIPLWGDVELAWRLRDKVGSPAPWLLVTGTNGKTTTVQLSATMLATAGHRVAPCGNIGVPVLDAIRDPHGFDVLVVELSSFQLHWLNRGTAGDLVPFSSVCLNVADDHLDWHGSVSGYRNAKSKVYANTQVACIYNRADPVTEEMVRDADVADGARAIGFGLAAPGLSDFGIVDGILCDRAFLDDRQNSALEIATLDALRVVGLSAPHMVENVLAASALARSYGVAVSHIVEAIQGFRLDKNRIELVASVDEVRWINDSKATNPHAAHASLGAFDSVVWIVGGLLKDVDVDDLVKSHSARLRGAIIIGRDRAALRNAFERQAPGLLVCEVDEIEPKNIMLRVVELAADVAQAGDVVLLAPAAASMDQFEDYADRGQLFADAVHQFLGGGAHDSDDSAASPGKN